VNFEEHKRVRSLFEGDLTAQNLAWLIRVELRSSILDWRY